MRPRCLQSERYPLLHPFRTSPAGADHIDARAVTIDTMDRATMVMAPATMVIMDTGTIGPGSMSDLATATMVGGVGRLGLFTYPLLLSGGGVPFRLASRKGV